MGLVNSFNYESVRDPFPLKEGSSLGSSNIRDGIDLCVLYWGAHVRHGLRAAGCWLNDTLPRMLYSTEGAGLPD